MDTMFIISRRENPKNQAFCGPLCYKAGIRLGLYYSTKEAAEKDCVKLNNLDNKFEIREINEDNFC